MKKFINDLNNYLSFYTYDLRYLVKILAVIRSQIKNISFNNYKFLKIVEDLKCSIIFEIKNNPDLICEINKYIFTPYKESKLPKYDLYFGIDKILHNFELFVVKNYKLIKGLSEECTNYLFDEEKKESKKSYINELVEKIKNIFEKNITDYKQRIVFIIEIERLYFNKFMELETDFKVDQYFYKIYLFTSVKYESPSIRLINKINSLIEKVDEEDEEYFWGCILETFDIFKLDIIEHYKNEVHNENEVSNE